MRIVRCTHRFPATSPLVQHGVPLVDAIDSHWLRDPRPALRAERTVLAAPVDVV